MNSRHKSGVRPGSLLIATAIISALTTGCAKKTISLDNEFNKNQHSKTQKVTLFYFFGDFGNAEEIQAIRICPQGVSGIEVATTLVDSLISVASLNVFTPKTITLYCKAPMSQTA